jgi:hypothetical protein
MIFRAYRWVYEAGDDGDETILPGSLQQTPTTAMRGGGLAEQARGGAEGGEEAHRAQDADG